MRWRFVLLVAFLLAAPARSDDWPQLMGPNRDNTTAEVVPAWKGEPRVLWRKSVGEGKTPPVIAGGKLYVQEKVEGKQEERLFCLDAATGKELWQAAYPRANFENNNGSGPRGAPAVAAGKVFTHGITGVLTCYDADSGKQLWQVDTHREFDVPVLKYGVFCSPLVIGNRVLLNVGGKKGSVVGFDTQTGKTAWKALADSVATASPVLYQAAGDELPHAVFMTDRRLVGVEPLDGSILWGRKLADDPFTNGPPPVWIGDTLIASARAFGAVGLRVSKKDNKYAVEEVWKNRELGSYYPTVAPLDANHFWMVTNGEQQ